MVENGGECVVDIFGVGVSLIKQVCDLIRCNDV